MFIGFDYGTSNCSVAKMIGDTPQLLAIEHDNFYTPSTLAAPTRESVSEHLFRHRNIRPGNQVGEQLLRSAMATNREEGIELLSEDIVFGQAALNRYLEDPQEIYYVKSPKSFLGAMGLREIQISFFEDLVCAMMANIKQRAEANVQQSIEDVVIGRPINFHGRGGDKSNQQAETILLHAAKRAGFCNIEFQFEPVAAGLEYEDTLIENKIVLVVDIGGGTTDCSLIQMGPDWKGKSERNESLLAHSGQRVGGNDLDINLTFKQLMHPFGLGSQFASGIEMPLTQFWNPIAINDIQAQKEFYSRENLRALKSLHMEAQEPEKLARLLKVYHDTLGYSLVRSAEEAKIALSDQSEHRVKLNLLSEVIEIDLHRDQMITAIESTKDKMAKLVSEAVEQGGTKPDVIFMTGGSASSPILRQAVEQVLPGIPLVSGNYFGSVTTGLARWAKVCFA
ncbi:molecular chaperone [Xenorhabdus bovienii]|uniref:Molecular chaperone n=1 Tax=Xenorhabdus bovienii TaxID=40576 RepID=A0AAJ1JAE8_XENBV|nr:molecular chaperone [Xenorhabdus bovienii]MDE1479826.1 molecular chaperone [Xenorhabdus bovienii]MDE1488435.1 molecular chaperone [Xenorhabdus bovienii]MDE1492123.1 molecular chaperone [Xenorhabdus bovienii]MDE9479302.1 molecular chaperone [Xenorhabdus bovienii]MDE9511436.1 molecular chaperone [Xenorhabdus bovienii]